MLQSFARRLQQACREYDDVMRLAGDEFVVIAPGLKRSDTPQVCTRIGAAAAASVKGVCAGVALSVSIGIAFYPEETCDAAQLLVEADKRMYAVKKQHHLGGSLLAMPGATPMTQ